MMVIYKGPNKGVLFDPNTGSNLGTFCGFFILSRIFVHRKSIQPHDGWITNPVTRWFHHTVGYFFLTTTTFKDLVYGQSSRHW